MLDVLSEIMSATKEAAEPDQRYLLIKNETTDGKRFRPSDWAERLQSTITCLEDEEFKRCIGLVQVVALNGSKCILVDKGLEDHEPRLYRFLMRFARENSLVTEAHAAELEEARAPAEQQPGSFRRAFSF